MRRVPRLALAVAIAVACAAFAGQAVAAPGAFVWKETPNPTAGNDALHLCAGGPAGAVYAAGTQGDYPDADIWVVKYEAGGAQAWSRTWAGPDGGYDEARGMVIDAAGNVYVCGRTGPASGLGDSLLLKYDAVGALAWATVYEAGASSDEAEAIGLDAAGDIYLAGWSDASAAATDVYTAKFRASDGVRQWTSWYSSTGSGRPRGIAVTGAGDSYVAGMSRTAAGVMDALLVKTSASGDQAWAKLWDGPQGRLDEWAAVELAPGGGVVVAGTTGSSRAGDFAAARYSSAGAQTWLRTWSSAGRWYDEVRDLAVAGDGSAWVAGATDRDEGDMRAALVKWSAAGRQMFVRPLGTRRIAAELSAITLDGDGNAYVAGSVQATGAGGGWDLLAARYARGGSRLWFSSAGFGADSQDGFDAIALGGPGFVYACGTAGWEGPDSRGVVVKVRR